MFELDKISKVTQLPPPPPENFLAWLDGFLTEKKGMTENEVEALRKKLNQFNSPRIIVESRK